MSPASHRLREYMKENGITVEVIDGPHWDVESYDDGSAPWEHHRYVVKFVHADFGTEFTATVKHGIGITEGPDERPEETFDIFISEAWSYECNPTFERWCDEYGYDPDSRVMEGTFNKIRTQANDFLDFIGGGRELHNLAMNYERL